MTASETRDLMLRTAAELLAKASALAEESKRIGAEADLCIAEANYLVDAAERISAKIEERSSPSLRERSPRPKV